MPKLKKLLKNFLYFFLALLPQRRGVCALMYHSIGRNKVDFTLSPERFSQQLDYLKKRGYHVIRAGELIDLIAKGKDLPQKAVVLTFDDGYEDNYKNAFSLLKEYNFPATIFLTPAYMGKAMNNSQNLPLKMLSWEQIRIMHESGLIDFEPHSLTHACLDALNPRDLKKEVVEPKEIIEKELNKKCFISAYPKGRYNQEAIEEFKKQGFRAVFTIKAGMIRPGDNLFKLKRFFVKNSLSSFGFQAHLKGYAIQKRWKY